MSGDDVLRRALLERVADEFERHLSRKILFEELVEELAEWMEPRTFEAGETMVAAGRPRDGMHLLQEGRASQFDPDGVRIHQFSPGDVIEPRGGFDTSAAVDSTIADEQCRTFAITPDARARLEKSDPQRMLKLYAYVLTADAPAAG